MSGPTLVLGEPMLVEEDSQRGRSRGKVLMCLALLLGAAAFFSLPESHHEEENLALWSTALGRTPWAAARAAPTAPKLWKVPSFQQARLPALRATNPGMQFGRGATYGSPRMTVRADDDIEGKIKKLIAENLDVDESKLTPEASFSEDLGADSLDTVELLMAMEEELGVEIPEEEALKLTSVGAVIDYAKKSR